MKMKLLSSAVLAVGLLSATVAVQAATETYRGWLSDIKDLAHIQFEVNNALDSNGVTLTTTSYAGKNFDPFLAVWDSSGLLIGFNNDIDRDDLKLDAFIDLGQLADGVYTVTIGNWPYELVGAADFLKDKSTAIYFNTAQYTLPANWSGTDLNPHGSGWGPWYTVTVTGVSAVPEPETWAMLLAGLGMVGAVARRRRQQ